MEKRAKIKPINPQTGVVDSNDAFLLIRLDVKTPVTPEIMTRTKARLKPTKLYIQIYTPPHRNQQSGCQGSPSSSGRSSWTKPYRLAPDSNGIWPQYNRGNSIPTRTMLLGLSSTTRSQHCWIEVCRRGSRRKRRYWEWARRSRMCSFRSRGIRKIWWFRWNFNL